MLLIELQCRDKEFKIHQKAFVVPNLKIKVKSDTKIGFRTKAEGVCCVRVSLVRSPCWLLIVWRLIIRCAKLMKK